MRPIRNLPSGDGVYIFVQAVYGFILRDGMVYHFVHHFIWFMVMPPLHVKMGCRITPCSWVGFAQIYMGGFSNHLWSQRYHLGPLFGGFLFGGFLSHGGTPFFDHPAKKIGMFFSFCSYWGLKIGIFHKKNHPFGSLPPMAHDHGNPHDHDRWDCADCSMNPMNQFTQKPDGDIKEYMLPAPAGGPIVLILCFLTLPSSKLT